MAQTAIARNSSPAFKDLFGQIFAGRVVVAALRPERPLDQEQGKNEKQHHAGDLRGPRKAVSIEPCIVNRDRQSPNPEEFDRADIV
jgi:hypothetical protein